MQNKGNILTSVIVLALGVVLFWGFDRPDVMRTIVIITAVAFVLPAVVNMLILVANTEKQKERSMVARAVEMVCCIGALALGVCMLVTPATFTVMIVYVFAFALIACGVFQVFMLVKGFRPIIFPGWMYVMPLIVLVGGVVVLLLPDLKTPDNTRATLLITAVGLIMTAVTGLLMSVGAASFAKKLTKKNAKSLVADEASTSSQAPTVPNAPKGTDNSSTTSTPARVEPETGLDIRRHDGDQSIH